MKIGNIVLPDNSKGKAFTRGTVKAVGPGLFLPNGDRPEIEVKKNNRVLYFKASAADIVVGGKSMHIIQEREIIGIAELGDFDNEGDSTDARN